MCTVLIVLFTYHVNTFRYLVIIILHFVKIIGENNLILTYQVKYMRLSVQIMRH